MRARNPLAEMLMIALPSVVTMTSYTVMQFIDGMMVSKIQPPDPVYVSAQGNGGMAVWLLLSFALGAMGVVNTFVSQHLGAGKPERGSAYGWSVLWISAVWALLLVPFAFVLPAVFRSMEHTPELVALETRYAQISLIGAFFVLSGRGIAHYFYGMHKPLIVMVSVLAANLLNVMLNAVLIYGVDGPPAGTPFQGQFQSIAAALDIAPMGVAGAAWGTVIGSSIELLVPLVVFLSPAMHRRYRTRSAWKPSVAHMRDIGRLGWAAGVMFLNEMLCWAFLMAYMLAAGGAAKTRLLDLPPEELDAAVEAARTTANTAGWIGLRYMHISFMPAIGISIAVTALVGKCMGMGRPDLAEKRAWLGMGLTVAYMSACAVVFVVYRERLIGVFIPRELWEADPEAAAALLRVGAGVMIAAAVFQVFDAVAITASAALRGAGDTIWPGIITVVSSWVCIVGIGFLLLHFAPQLGSMGPWIGASAYIIMLGVLLMIRFMRGKWKTIDVLGQSADGGGSGTGGTGGIGGPRDDFDTLPAPTGALAGGMPGEA
ncbi:MAG: MATE family efflux transporter [Planctomycetota bacterium]|nr:MATE family efflux transporter [Planctomycetota bacterium]